MPDPDNTRPAPPLLVLMRHGTAAAYVSGHGDFYRPLNARGEDEAGETALHLKPQLPDPEQCLILSSPARRTEMTSDILSGCLNIRKEQIVYEPSLYSGADPASILNLVFPLYSHDIRAVIVTGHNPMITEFAAMLDPYWPFGAFRPACAAIFQFADGPDSGAAKRVFFHCPGQYR